MDPREFNNLDLLSRQPGQVPTPGQSGSPFDPDTQTMGSQPQGAIGFDRVDHFSYVAPPSAGIANVLFTVPQDVTRGLILGIGIGSTEFDWFGTHSYYFAVNNAPPRSQQFGNSLGSPSTGVSLDGGTFFRYTTVGTVQRPKRVNISINVADRWMMMIPPSSVPAAGTVIYNIWVRTVGVLFR